MRSGSPQGEVAAPAPSVATGWSRLREIACPPALPGSPAPPLRVLQLTNMYPSVERPNWGVFIQSQIVSLARQGVTSEVLEIEGWRATGNYLRALLALPWRGRRSRHELLHVHFGLNLLACLGLRGRPLVVSFCGNDFWGRPGAGGVRSRGSVALAQLSRWAARRADAVIVKSADMAQALGPGYRQVEVIANGVDFDLFAPLPRDRARQQLGWPLEREILLFPANPQDARKNFALAQAVQQRLLAAGRPVQLEWMYGRPQSDIVLGMAAADVMLSCSWQEGSPNAVKEAMAMNLPVVATAVGDCAQRLKDCQPGAVVVRDEQAFAAAVTAVLTHPARRSNGREQAAQLDIDLTARRVVQVYRDVLQRRSRAGQD